jgi:hypothetical protein
LGGHGLLALCQLLGHRFALGEDLALQRGLLVGQLVAGRLLLALEEVAELLLLALAGLLLDGVALAQLELVALLLLLPLGPGGLDLPGKLFLLLAQLNLKFSALLVLGLDQRGETRSVSVEVPALRAGGAQGNFRLPQVVRDQVHHGLP